MSDAATTPAVDLERGWAPRPVSADRFELGEGARWLGDRFVQVSLLAGVLYEVDVAEGRLREILRTADLPLGAVAPVAGTPGTWIAAVGTGIALLRPGSPVEWLGRPEEQRRSQMRMNDGVADPSGRFWAGSMAYESTPDAGRLYRVEHDGTVVTVLDGITIPNGPAFSPDGATMYLADTARGRIDAYPVDPAGDLGSPECLFSASDGGPDGMVVDAEGSLWVALWGASAVARIDPTSGAVHRLPVPSTQPTSIAIGGRGGTQAVITSAGVGLDGGGTEGATLVTEAGVRGLPAVAATVG